MKISTISTISEICEGSTISVKLKFKEIFGFEFKFLISTTFQLILFLEVRLDDLQVRAKLFYFAFSQVIDSGTLDS